MKILALERAVPGVADDAFTPTILEDEARRAWALYQAGTLRELYFRADRQQAVLVLECGSLEDAHVTLATLPLVASGLIAFDLAPLAPYPGFARLFAHLGSPSAGSLGV